MSRFNMTNKINDWLITQGPAFDFTCDEVEVALKLSHQSCSARFRDMKLAKTILPTGYRRQTRTGSYAAIFRINWDRAAENKPYRIRNIQVDSPGAQELLRRRQERYAEWETIPDGTLIDGQHRMFTLSDE